jgi:hypothetical protein
MTIKGSIYCPQRDRSSPTGRHRSDRHKPGLAGLERSTFAHGQVGVYGGGPVHARLYGVSGAARPLEAGCSIVK